MKKNHYNPFNLWQKNFTQILNRLKQMHADFIFNKAHIKAK